MRRREFLSAFYQATIVNEPSAENTGVDFLPLTSLIKKHKNCKGAPVRCTKGHCSLGTWSGSREVPARKQKNATVTVLWELGVAPGRYRQENRRTPR
ncbi:hypothetical protein NDU88_003911 [Pleurodeles waltl]|uniref:Uncharacterized protein n=1 Tax=Pleurodeles waltl TaxID=8319 RepID=A0AAV7T7Q3_PLEWA|nr:hypothetical protein NDU88_003911 [Pleurodeles waltl]